MLTLRGPSGPRRGSAMRELGIIREGCVLITDGLIAEVGTAQRILNLGAARGAEVIDATGCVVMPGFVDSHTHLLNGPPRLLDFEMQIAGASREQISEAGGGPRASGRNVKATPGPRLQHRARRILEGCARHGTTTLEAKSGYGLDSSGEAKTLRALAVVNGDPIDVIPTFLSARNTSPEETVTPEEYMDWLATTLFPKLKAKKLARFADIDCELGGLTDGQARRYATTAAAFGMDLKVHADRLSRTGMVKFAVESNAISVDHLEMAGDEEARLLAASNAVATLLPGSTFHSGAHDYAPARTLIDAGAAVALATNYNPDTSPTFSMPMMLALACRFMHMSPAEAVSAATINGAHALKLAHRIGSIEYGKQADILIMDMPDYREIPYLFGINPVRITIKNGKVIWRRPSVLYDE